MHGNCLRCWAHCLHLVSGHPLLKYMLHPAPLHLQTILSRCLPHHDASQQFLDHLRYIEATSFIVMFLD